MKHYLLFAAACLLMAAPVWAQGEDDEARRDLRAEEEATRRESGIAYGVELTGVDKGLRETLRGLMQSVELQDFPPPTEGLLERRGRNDLERIRRGLRALGYYAGEVTLTVETREEPALLRYAIDRGEAYRLSEVAVSFVGDGSEAAPEPPDPERLGMPTGEVFETTMIESAQTRLAAWLRERGYPRPALVDREIVVEHSDASVQVRFEVEPGVLAHFGEVTVAGLERLDEPYVRKLIPWESGDRFASSALNRLRQRLSASNLFAGIQIETEVVGEQVDVHLALEEGKPRTIRTGVGYSSDIGAYVRLGWEHRNFSGQAESLRITTQLAERQQEAQVDFRKPMWRREDQDLLLQLRISQESFDAYDSDSVRTSAAVERRLTETWTGRLGLAFRYADVLDDDGTQEAYSLLSVPMELAYDGSDDLLDPRHGMRLSLSLAPTADVTRSDVRYLRGRAGWRGYWPVLGHERLVLAGKVAIGSIQGAQVDDVPADERFYAGGGGSVRGYDYQVLAPFRDGKNLGGMSLVETSIELRWLFTERFGLVGFVDGGNAYEERYPDFSEPLRWGTGLGLRYHTPIGPVRLDLGVPVNPANDDRDLHIYLSIGQAF